MTFFIGKEKVDLTRSMLDNMYIGEGKEGTIYRYKDKALKIYHEECSKDRLNEETCLYLSRIDTNRILLPKDLVYDEDKSFIGYTTDYHERYCIENIRRMKTKDLKEELELIKKDIITLSKNNVYISDLYIDNIILSDGLYFIDPGSFFICKDNERYIYYNNMKNVNNFIMQYLLAKTCNVPKKRYNDLYQKLDYDEFISESLPNGKETTQNFIKKLII